MSKPPHLITRKSFTIEGDFSKPLVTWHWFLETINRLPGLTLVGLTKHIFPNNGLSGVVLIAESHAAIHTWPEHSVAWCELATCGDPATCDVFERLCRKYEPPHAQGE